MDIDKAQKRVRKNMIILIVLGAVLVADLIVLGVFGDNDGRGETQMTPVLAIAGWLFFFLFVAMIIYAIKYVRARMLVADIENQRILAGARNEAKQKLQKICAYCKATNEPASTVCSACGSREFK